MNFLTGRLVNGFDRILTHLLVKRFGLLDGNKLQKSECPELEILAAYVDHTLVANQIKKLEGHLVECRLCRKTVIHTFNSQKLLADPVLLDIEKM